MASKVESVIDTFKNSFDNTTDYSLKDMIKKLEDSYSSVYGGSKKKTKAASGEKKPPSAYNIFIRDEIARIRQENLDGVPANEFMKIAAERWRAQKTKNPELQS